jgi:predicted small lipoprotein YifL
MGNWKAIAGVVLIGGLLSLAACAKEKEPLKPPPPDPLTACRNECKNTSEKMFKECSDKLTAEQAFDRLTECNTQADDYSKKCRSECDQKAAATKQG